MEIVSAPAKKERIMSIWYVPNPDPNYDANQAARQAWFAKISPAPSWKMPISCWIEESDFENCSEAAVFFTGAPLTITAKSFGKVKVEAPGYYNTIGA